ncbi:PRC-barrel domain protein [Paraliobacillus sp. PM-2]|uniref:PRC-barrel domain-containing protein n=1 Tax=Paraliobacillus sp. PM-2 TaxID=1462524 RepID=UPI00061CC7DF|nr:PRC-barrel domain-containing protein [Paraliobacillus sp. PM-2]CQR47515.1 PRC-barrel domain protein [Paraliobacillus sp. PM-2]
MIRRLSIFYLGSTVKQLKINASDGKLGGVLDIYFDDKFWTVRYLVVDTRKWLPGKKVLLSPVSFDSVDMENGSLHVLATTEMIKNAPNQHEDEPVSKQAETKLINYYGWPNYSFGLGGLAGPWGGYTYPQDLVDAQNSGLLQNDVSTDDAMDHHLRSVNEIDGSFFGYRVEASDGEIGHVSDFVIDDENWKIYYIVVNTNDPLASDHILLSTDWINKVEWASQKVFIDLTKDQFKEIKDFDPNEPITRAYEEKLYSKLGKPKYWEL